MERWLKLVEKHIEKGVLGIAVLALLAMGWLYLVNSPNKVKYGSRELGPGELMQAIKAEADQLQQRMRAAEPEPIKVEEFAKQLEQIHSAGIFYRDPASKAPPLVATLPRAESFGKKIVMPGQNEGEAQAGTIVLVKPLPPDEPKLRTGRSLVVRKPTVIPGFEEEAPNAEEQPAKPVETAWVTVAAYYNKKAQFQEMIKAHYAPFRARAYVVGLDVQRQVMLSNGEFSDWEDVPPGPADPQLKLPEPVFDDKTGKLTNRNELREAFEKVKAAQPYLMEPDFYEVEAGDFWEMPPLAGYEEKEEQQKKQEEEAVALVRGGNLGGRALVAPPTGRIRSGRPTGRPGMGGRGAIGGRGGMGGRGAMGGRGGMQTGARRGPSPAANDAKEKRAARKAIRQTLTKARKLLGQKDYREALDAAKEVLTNSFATKGNQREAEKIIKLAERFIKRQEELAGRMSSERRAVKEIIRKPDSGEPAVWFHDDSVESGKTYRYRMRVKLWNRYVGQLRAVKNPDDAKKTTIAGQWSFPSEPITVTPSTYFFVSGARPADHTASVEVWKWLSGRWIKQRFDVTIGDVIGGLVRAVRTGELDESGNEKKVDVDFTTGAVVLDLRFDEPIKERWPQPEGKFSYRKKTSTVLVYLDPADGQVKQRALLFDRRSKIKKRLEDEAW